MNLNTEYYENVAVITLEPQTINIKKFRAAIAPVVEKYKNLIFDMSQMKLIDSGGCGALLTCLRKLNSSGGDLRLCGVQTPVLTLFELLRIHRVVDIFETREEAVASF
jgi:anti-sigma B factor antagonist